MAGPPLLSVSKLQRHGFLPWYCINKRNEPIMPCSIYPAFKGSGKTAATCLRSKWDHEAVLKQVKLGLLVLFEKIVLFSFLMQISHYITIISHLSFSYTSTNFHAAALSTALGLLRCYFTEARPAELQRDASAEVALLKGQLVLIRLSHILKWSFCFLFFICSCVPKCKNYFWDHPFNDVTS